MGRPLLLLLRLGLAPVDLKLQVQSLTDRSIQFESFADQSPLVESLTDRSAQFESLAAQSPLLESLTDQEFLVKPILRVANQSYQA